MQHSAKQCSGKCQSWLIGSFVLVYLLYHFFLDSNFPYKTCADTRTKGCCKWHLCDSNVIVQRCSSSSSRDFVSSTFRGRPSTQGVEAHSQYTKGPYSNSRFPKKIYLLSCLDKNIVFLVLVMILFSFFFLQVFVGSEAHNWIVLTRYINGICLLTMANWLYLTYRMALESN
jgi:hypothetical protein